MNVKHYLVNRHNNKYKNKLEKEVEQIREFEFVYEELSDDEIKTKFKEITVDKDSLNREEVLKLYALGTVMIDRILNLHLFDVQLQGALALYDGNIAEMKTGEGKTVTSVLPVLVQSALGQVHVCTVNEYLADRDKTQLEPVYNFFNKSVAMNFQADSLVEKINHYTKDIVYGTASTFGFDYLYDNMVTDISSRACNKPRKFALVDEVDLVLIDEARTPLIIGRPKDNNTVFIQQIDNYVKTLTKDDYEVDIKHKTVNLTESGIEKLSKLTNKENLFDDSNILTLHLIYQSLVANYLYKEDIDYALIVNNNEKQVAIIDTYTGRIQPDRRFSQGLHQALEAKHIRDGVKIKQETTTVATITLQNFFRLYEKLAGMSGTSHEEQDEFMKVYGLNVVKIDTNKPMQRIDNEIKMHTKMYDKWEDVCNKIKEYNKLQYPVLVGTVSVEDSETLSKILTENKLAHVVLNAKQDANEAEIISKAGKRGAITIATNMAGRGTDIKPESDEHPLVVIMTELNESKRIDNQLKGRTSRQGALGITETILSTDDSIFKKTTVHDKLKKMVTSSFIETSAALKVANIVQDELNSLNSSARQNALKYDDIIREQRNIFYDTRDKILYSNDIEELVQFYSKLNIEEDLIKKLKDRLEEIKSDDAKETFLRNILLNGFDSAWVDHIDNLDSLKTLIGWRAQSGHNPIIVYQNEAQKLYENFINKSEENIREVLEGIK